jgi:trehalose-6-phosphate synthase/HAMP domain-containing protein
MRFFVRLFGAIWVATLVVTVGFAVQEIRADRERLLTDLQRRAAAVADAVREATERALARDPRSAGARAVKRFDRPDRAVAIFDELGSVIDASPAIKTALGPLSPSVSEGIREDAKVRSFATIAGRRVWVHIEPLHRGDGEAVIGAAAVLLDASYLEEREWDIWGRAAVHGGALILLLGGLTWLLVRWSITRPMARMSEWTRQLKTGRPETPPPSADAGLFGGLAMEVTGLARSLARARVSAAEEARLRLSGESLWTEERLKQFVQLRSADRPIVVVANREPLSHVWAGRRIARVRPASGLVTALEPVLIACGGTWIAHGSGDADMSVGERVRLPEEEPLYTLRRVWLSAEDEDGYYYGFANEGLWPLCHIVHERPRFRAEDWERYRSVNERFARAVLEEIEAADRPIVLVQDYHFALVPRLIKQHRPDASVALFWHIPWPNVEVFGICPWQEEILLGMLGADLVGFHTQFHCNNFLDTVERAIEARVEWDRFAVLRGSHATRVHPFPISVAPSVGGDDRALDRWAWREKLGIAAEFVGIGVERLDYTKGLVERLLALRRFFERWPEYRERLVFVQIASPSRSRIPRYARLQEEVRALVLEINDAIGTGAWRPIVFHERHHDHDEVSRHYRAADFCAVTSLHDGMNLVAKEFVSARDDGDGVLILSRFAGAARELGDAVLVNPYDIEMVAEAVRAAITMPVEDRRLRMARMRAQVGEQNVYRWAGLLLSELARTPTPKGATPMVEQERS